MSISAFASCAYLLAPLPQFVIPLMLVFIVARSVGNRVNEGLYDTQISLKKMPFLEQVRARKGSSYSTNPSRRWHSKRCNMFQHGAVLLLCSPATTTSLVTP